MSFPLAVPDWNNLAVLHRNTLPPRPHFYIYDDEAAALARDIKAARVQCLSGTWQFHLSKTPLEGPADFHTVDFDASAAAFHDIAVPGMWQLQGHGRGPHYANIQYPWPVDPPHVPLEHNECGRYRTHFCVSETFAASSQLRLRFEGVDAAFTVWLNGVEVGYSQGSRNPSEFDVTHLVQTGPKAANVLAVEVYQRCDGSYIEDQDQWWLSGIFRDVYLHAFPATAHPLDLQVETALDDDFVNATLRVAVSMSASSHISLKLLDRAAGSMAVVATEAGPVDAETTVFSLPVTAPHKWTAETPYLYDLVVDFGTGVVGQRVGFRRAELINGVFRVNGQLVKLRGVNRHEHHPDSGRTVPYDFMKQDLLLMKHYGLNAIRTSHQINDVRMYELADELGFWIMDEADLECHGFGEIGLSDPAAPLSDNPDWEAAYVDRAQQMVQRDKNFSCVVMWSLGNESFYGRNHRAMYATMRRIDPTRIIHYEGDQDAETSDVYSRMYPPVTTVVSMAEDVCLKSGKPLVLCEFIHAMGNGPGGIHEYIDTFYKYPQLMGGFLWEWSNHGLRTSKNGHTFMAYGGDYGDVPNDGNFIMDGCVFSDHRPNPGLIEYAKAIEPVQITAFANGCITIVNRYDFVSLDHLVCYWDVVAPSGTLSMGELPIPPCVRPHTEAVLSIDPNALKTALAQVPRGEVYLKVRFCQRQATEWAPAQHQVAFGEFQLSKPAGLDALMAQEAAISSLPASPSLTQPSPTTLAVASASGCSVWGFDLIRGALASWTRDGREQLSAPLTMDFHRAQTDNDREIHGRGWTERRLGQEEHYMRDVKWTEADGTAVVEVHGRIAPPVFAWGVDVTWTFTVRGDTLAIRVQGFPKGAMLPEFFARIGLTLGLAGDVAQVAWWGRGPGESYCDKKRSQSYGCWTSTVDDLLVDYEFPQETSNRTDVREIEFTAGPAAAKTRLLRARFGDLDGASFTALHYTTRDLDESRHPYELHQRKRPDTIVRLDWKHHGLGSGSCGPATEAPYQLKAEPFDCLILLD